MTAVYTPTTEEVRDAWRNSTFDALDGTEFDRWLASVKAEAWDEGRESVTFGVRSGQATEIRVRHTPNPYREQETQ